ncbi:hypothetical protein LRS10_05795 [Phenylobacterium sp. J426]|uniref:hypothetical protein n=1 Tax=Phenylobacterium sp. J426 TaxID=2898439 RepID=UPI00215117C6|nr:hypothetical protein [Phenylobacterium sp. J426]MCR5873731.1 hypothetical protein [Phenylobacterium sp. J426]
MITLHGYGPGGGLPETSLSAMKSEVLLQIAGVGYRKAELGLAGSPVLEVMGQGASPWRSAATPWSAPSWSRSTGSTSKRGWSRPPGPRPG